MGNAADFPFGPFQESFFGWKSPHLQDSSSWTQECKIDAYGKFEDPTIGLMVAYVCTDYYIAVVAVHAGLPAFLCVHDVPLEIRVCVWMRVFSFSIALTG